ncbi:MAG: ABC transporter substrate-binding protein [Oscillospiraceae bacterium]|jgi:peptide/nickel transport system substrate-binding protein
MNYPRLALLLAAVLLVAGCGQPPPPPDTAATVAREKASFEAPSLVPDRLIIGTTQELESLDPGIMADAGTTEVMYNIFHGLVNITPEGNIVPELSKGYEVSEDRLFYTFFLREDAKFHNGHPVQAEDVAYTYRRMMGQTEDQKEPLQEELAKIIKEIVVQDQTTVRFELNRPSPVFLSLCMAGIIPRDSGAGIAAQPIGAGPYQFASYSPGEGISMVRFEDYYGKKPFFPAVEFRFFTNNTAVQLAMQREELHIIKLEAGVFTYDESKLKLLKQPQNMVQMMAFRHDVEPFSHLGVRQAINYAIDKQSIIDALSPGSPKIDTHFSPAMGFYYNQQLENYYPYHPEQAKHLLAQAGYADLSFTVKVPTEYPFHLDTAEMIRQQLAQVGVTMEIEAIEWERWLTEVYSQHDYEATIVGLAGKTDPSSVMIRPTSGYRHNFFRYHNPEYDRLVAEAAGERDQNRRAQLYREAQKIATQDALMVPLMDPGIHLLMDKHLEGYLTYPIGYMDLRSLYWA